MIRDMDVGLGKIKRFYKKNQKKIVKFNTNTLYLLWPLVLYSDISLLMYISSTLLSHFVSFRLYM